MHCQNLWFGHVAWVNELGQGSAHIVVVFTQTMALGQHLGMSWELATTQLEMMTVCAKILQPTSFILFDCGSPRPGACGWPLYVVGTVGVGATHTRPHGMGTAFRCSLLRCMFLSKCMFVQVV